MHGILIRADLTDAQKSALRWLLNRGGSGVFNRNNVLLAQGELAGVMRSTWKALADAKPAYILINKKRVELTDAGKVVAMTVLTESDCVDDEGIEEEHPNA